MPSVPSARRAAARLLARLQRHGMLLVILALLTWSWAVSLWFIAEQKRHLLADRSAELALMAGAVAEQSAGVLRTIDSDLRTIDLWLQTHPTADPLRDPRLMTLVDEMRRASRGAMDLRLVDEAGGLHYLPSPDGRPRANVADRSYVTAHTLGQGLSADGLHVGAPVTSRVTQRRDVPVSRALTAPPHPAADHLPGPRMAVVFAAVDIERMAAEHERIRFKDGGSIVLMRTDGILLSRAPLVPAYLGLDLSHTPQFNAHYGRQARGAYVSDGGATDGVARLVSYERLDDFPVTVLVTRGLDEIFGAYYARLRIVLVLSGLLSLVVLGVTAFLLRAQSSRRAMEAAQHHLRRLAATDELTGVVNRRAFIETARGELDRAKRRGATAAVLALDIDHFKHINDRYGHSGGDLVLRVCASRWQAALRDQDVLGRLGGEEFCVLLPETSAANAATVAERLRRATAATPVLGTDQGVTVSVGWAVADVDGEAWESVYERADQALYTAKAQGRNCVRPEGVPAPSTPAAACTAGAHGVEAGPATGTTAEHDPVH